jgi:hypothetical protein
MRPQAANTLKNKTRRLNEELRAANQKRYGELEAALAAEMKNIYRWESARTVIHR